MYITGFDISSRIVLFLTPTVAKRSLNQVAASNIGNKMLNPSLRIK